MAASSVTYRPESGDCYLCLTNDTPLTPEHVLPIWLGDYLRPKLGPMGFTWRNPDGNRVFADRWTWKVPVCSPCNAWMNETIEEPARDIIKQLVVGAYSLDHLTRGQQTRVATWILKTAIFMDEWMHRNWNTPRTCPRSTIEFFYTHGAPGLEITIWMGLLADYYTQTAAPENLRPKAGFDKPWMVPNVTWAPIHIIGRWIVQTVCHPGTAAWTVDLPVELEPHFFRIWPPHKGVLDWPPPVIIDRPTYETIIRMGEIRDPRTIEPKA